MLRAMRPTMLFALFASLLLSCETGGLPQGYGDTPPGSGPRIVWDLNAEPLPELPLPNDIATWPDPTARTGRRINVSMVAPTGFEEQTREIFDTLDGWGTYAAISVPFDAHIDVRDLYARQGGSSEAFRTERWPDHAVYLIDLETGLPMPLDVNSGNFQFVLDNPSQYFPNDPRAGESNLLFETVDEDTNGNGVLDPGEDTDFDGHLDEPNTFDGTISDPLDTVDQMTWFYERESKTLLLRPILPLDPHHEYAVVITDRLKGVDGQPVRSPFDTVHHIAQRAPLASLPAILSEHRELYGDMATRGWDGVAFAWTFTTQSTTDDLDVIRQGLYGEGPMARLRDDFPPDYAPAPMQGGRRCEAVAPGVYVAPAELFLDALDTILNLVFEVNGPAAAEIRRSYEESLSHLVVAVFDSPFFIAEDPDATTVEDTFQVDSVSGEARVSRETITMMMLVPKERPGSTQPFPAAFYVHGYGSVNAETIPFASYMLQNGVAALSLNAEGHGVPLDDSLLGVLGTVFASACLEPMADAIIDGRAEDFDGDGTPDSGVDFWTAYVFHTRDTVRQTVVDHMRAIQLLRSFDGRPAEQVVFHGTTLGLEGAGLAYDANIHDYPGPDVAGDFDGDGVPDVGGTSSDIFFTGGSLGGIISGVMGGVEPEIRATAPIVGAGGLTDVAVRTENGGVLRAMHLRMMGPFVMALPAEERSSSRTRCGEGQTSLFFYANERNERAEVEFACVPSALLDENSVVIVSNARNGEDRCAGATGGSAEHFRVGFPADAGDALVVGIHPGRAGDIDYTDCTLRGGSDARATFIDSFYPNTAGELAECEDCSRYQRTTFVAGDTLVSPAVGFGHRRQSPDLRRLLYLAQVGLEPADPINYARRVFLEPVGRPVNLLVANSIGDQNVPLSAGNAYARAAGVLPFLPPEAPSHLRDWRAPASFETRYPGVRTPNDLLLQYHVLEGVDRLERHPEAGLPPFFLYDVDNVSEGRLRFRPDGQHQSNEADAVGYPHLDQPLRWVRQSRPMRTDDDDVWTVLPGDDISGLLNHYVVPVGVHGFDELVYDPALPWDPAQYLINLISRWGSTGGQDLPYHSDPDGHTCLENSSCPYLR